MINMLALGQTLSKLQLAALGFVASLGACGVVCYLLFILIERPGIELGKSVVGKFRYRNRRQVPRDPG